MTAANETFFPWPDSPAAEEAFAEFLARRDRGEQVSIDALVAEHPSLEGELRRAHDFWVQFEHALGADTRAGALESLVAEFGAEVDPRVHIEPADEQPTATRFRVRRAVGRGGMGVVFEVHDPDLNRTLAMKVIRADATPRGTTTPGHVVRRVSRFLEEAQITGQLQHPGIPPIHELGTDAGGRVWFTMPLIEGHTLAEIIDLVARGESGWTTTRALGVLSRVCETMAFAHANGVVHRDLKPSNVMVGRFGETYVMDWGLARVLGRADTRDVRLENVQRLLAGESVDSSSPIVTMEGDVVGTPAYMPPEQASGRVDEIGPRSDVFAVGAMLYHLLARVPPYRDASSPREVLERACRADVEPLRELSPDSPGALVAICERAMALDPAQRYADMGAMSEDLRAWLEGRVVRAYESGGWAELRAWTRRNTRLAVALGAAALLLVLALGTFWASAVERAQAERFFDLARLGELRAQAEVLWPEVPSRAAAMRTWLARARDLAARLPAHEATLAELGAGDGELDPSAFDDWMLLRQRELVDGLRAFADVDPGVGAIADVEERLAFAQTVRERTLVEAEDAWERAIERIADPGGPYGGFALAPQLGLVPLGPDPVSRLEELAHVRTGTVPERDADGTLVLADDFALVFVLLPGGTHALGAVEGDSYAYRVERPATSVALAPYFVSKYELTEAQWRAATRRSRAAREAAARAPARAVPQREAVAVLARLGLALPTEAQWEYAARGGVDAPWWWGWDEERIAELEVVAASSTDGGNSPRPVGSLAPNPFGLYDVLGNLGELTSEVYAPYEASAPRDAPDGRRTDLEPTPSAKYVVRGGDFTVRNEELGPDMVQKMTRASWRLLVADTDAYDHFGMRPVRRVE